MTTVSTPARRSHSLGNIDVGLRKTVEKPIDFETASEESPPKKVLKVPNNLREEINSLSPLRTSTPSSDHDASLLASYDIINTSSVEKSMQEKSNQVLFYICYVT